MSSTKEARLTATLSSSKYHDVLVVAFDDWGGRGVPRSPLHILIVEVTSDYTSDNSATTIRRLADRISLVCLSEDVA
jgi:hypothetical protein